MEPYLDDFTYYYFFNGELRSAKSVMSVPEEIEDFVKISDAVSFVQKIGCQGRSQHEINSEFHLLCLAVLRIAVEKYGKVYPVLLRGTRSNRRPDSEYKILFGTTDENVAKFYGLVKQYYNVKGLRTNSLVKSVLSDDYDEIDEEIIFFPV